MEAITKFQPNRTMHLQGFSDYGAAASAHHATATGWQISGIFRDAADFAIFVIFQADDFFGHSRNSYFPHNGFAGVILQFDLTYGTSGLQPIESPKFASIGWDSLTIRSNGSDPSTNTTTIRLFDNAMLAPGSGGLAVAGASFVITGSNYVANDTLILWYENFAFQYSVPYAITAFVDIFNSGVVGAANTISISGPLGTVSLTHNTTALDTTTTIASALAAISSPYASVTSASNRITFTRLLDDGSVFTVSAFGSGGGGGATMCSVKNTTVASALAVAFNTANWPGVGPPLGILAVASTNTLNLFAARYGYVNVASDGISVSLQGSPSASNMPFGGMSAGDPIVINNLPFTVATITTPYTLTLAGVGTGGTSMSAVNYLAPRGGSDGDMICIYSTCSDPSTLSTADFAKFAGGGTGATWRVILDLDSYTDVEKMWLSFAPPLADSGAFSDTEFNATFSNVTITDPNGNTQLQVAGIGSARIEENDDWCVYAGFWESPPDAFAFWSQGNALRCAGTGVSVTVETHCSAVHDIYIGTFLDVNCGILKATLDGITSVTIDCYRAANSDSRTCRRGLFGSVPAGQHSVKIEVTGTKNTLSSGYYLYFDYLECAIATDVPPPFTTYTDVAVATDFDTNHGYNLSPQRLVWMIRNLGLYGEVDHYLGVFWWNQRYNPTRTLAVATVTFSGTWVTGDQVILDFSGTPVGKSIFIGDTSDSIAAHFAFMINETQVGIWASYVGPVLTVTQRSATSAYQINLTLNYLLATGTPPGAVAISGNLNTGVVGTWDIDTTQTPVLNRAIRDWHADFFAELVANSMTAVVAFSNELVLPPDNPPTAVWTQRFPDGVAVTTQTGFGILSSAQCAFSPVVQAYMGAAYSCMAGLMSAASLAPYLQFGEILWWFFSDYSLDPANPPAPVSLSGGMAFFDAYTVAQFLAAQGRAMYRFLTPNDSPNVNAFVDAAFLRALLKAHVDAIKATVIASYPTCKFELLWPLDVNYPSTQQLDYYINLPTEWTSDTYGIFDSIVTEGFQFGGTFRNLDQTREIAGFGFNVLAWAKAKCKYLMGNFNSGWPWQRDLIAGQATSVPMVKFWAFDHLNLFNRKFPLPTPSTRVISTQSLK